VSLLTDSAAAVLGLILEVAGAAARWDKSLQVALVVLDKSLRVAMVVLDMSLVLEQYSRVVDILHYNTNIC